MTTKKIFGITGLVLFFLSLVGMLYFALPKGKTVDFAGFVDEVRFDSNKQCVYITVNEPLNDVTYEIEIFSGTKCQNFNGEPFTISNIKSGDFIEANFKKQPKFINGIGHVTVKGTVLISQKVKED